jgi:N-acetylglutamate synthase-like GNAT family acetyltransferase
MMLRKANTNDVDRIVELEKDYYDGYSISKNVLAEWIRTGRYYVVEKDGEIVGSIYFEFLKEIKSLPWEHEAVDEKPNYVYISEIAIKSEDVLQELFSKVLESAQQRSVKSILWLTGEKSKHDRIEQKFLKSNNFVKKERVENWEYAPGYFISDHSIWELELKSLHD